MTRLNKTEEESAHVTVYLGRDGRLSRVEVDGMWLPVVGYSISTMNHDLGYLELKMNLHRVEVVPHSKHEEE